MDFKDDFKGKTALVTGAGSGIGQAIAIGLGQAGATVICVGRTLTKLEETVAAIRSHGAEGHAVSLDVTDAEATAKLAERLDREYTTFDIVYLNAGGGVEVSEIVDSDIDRWRYDIEVNMFSVFYGIKYFSPLMKKRGGGKFIFTGSGLAQNVRPESSSYCGAKAGVRMVARVAAAELAKDNITVNELIPGPTLTPLTMNSTGAAFNNPNEWVKQPEDVVDFALSLAVLPGKGPTGQIFSLMRR